MKKQQCKNTYFNREIGGYIDMLLTADGLLTSLEKAAEGGIGVDAVRCSSELDAVIADIMKKRETVGAILSAEANFN